MASRLRRSIAVHGNLHLLVSLLLLLSNNKVSLLGHGRATQKLRQGGEGGDQEMEVRSMVGSRPPRCIRSCPSCRFCEAILVPVVPLDRDGANRWFLTRINFRGDSNYKPVSWKCKCGNTIFNP